MKKVLLCSLLLVSGILFAQTPVDDSVSLGSNYTKMSFYSMADGESANVNAKDWDLQFGTSLMDAAIRVNDGASVVLYNLQNSDTSNWMSVDTSGATPLYNADTSWNVGAFNILSTGQFDYGWGSYDIVSHNVIGSKIFVVKTINGNYKKVWVRRLIQGDEYEVKMGNLDNSADTTITMRKSDYPGKTSFYYAIDSAEAKDIEPADTAWDIVFRRYQTYITFPPPAQFYTVMGVLSSPAVTVAEARGADVNLNNYSAHTYDDMISVIGSDWKNFNQTTFQWEFIDSLVYFISAQDGNIYKILFTGFGGAATGKVKFTKTNLTNQSTAVNEISDINSLTVYPNPSADNVQVLFSVQKESDVTIKILDLSGKSHFTTHMQSHSGLNALTLQTDELAQGFYLLTVDDGNSKLTYKLVRN